MFYTMYPHTNLVAGSAVCVSSVYVQGRRQVEVCGGKCTHDNINIYNFMYKIIKILVYRWQKSSCAHLIQIQCLLINISVLYFSNSAPIK